MHLRLLAAFALLAAACGTEVSVDASAPPGAQQGVVSVISLAISDTNVDEGDSVTADIGQLCATVNPATQNVALVVTFSDGGTTNRTLATARAGDAGTCGVGNFIVCDDANQTGTDAGCYGIPHTFLDDSEGEVAVPVGQFRATAQATQGAATVSDTEDITVNNLNPVISLARTGVTIEGRPQTLTLTTADPALVAGEIQSVTWVFAPDAQVGDVLPVPPTTVTCTCLPTVTCSDGSNIEPACGETNSSRQRLFLDDNGPAPTNLGIAYTVTATVTDKDGGTATVIQGPTAISNASPNNLEISAVGTGVNGALSAVIGSRTTVIEGAEYDLTAAVEEAGIDELAFTWTTTNTLNTPVNGTGAVTKAAYPAIVNLNPAGVLTPQNVRWDDDNDGNPATGLNRTISFAAVDDDTGSNSIDRFVVVQDISPTATLAATTATAIDESQSVSFSLTTAPGDAPLSPSVDALTRREWHVRKTVPSALDDNITNGVDGGNVYTIVSGCGANDNACTLSFADDDPNPTYAVEARVFDEDSSTLSNAVAVNVANVLPTHSAVFSSQNINEAGSIDVTVSTIDPAGAGDGTYTATINFGDGTAAVNLTRAAPGTFAVANHTYTDNDVCGPSTSNATCQVTIKVCETGGLLCSVTTSDGVTVNNVAPVATATAPDGVTLIEGGNFSFDGSFTDVATNLDEPYAFEWSWQDGVASRSVTTGSPASFANRATATDVAGIAFQNVPAAGISAATFTLSVTDEDLGNDTDTVTSSVRDNVPLLAINSVVLNNGGNELATPTVTVTIAAESNDDRISNIVVQWGDGTTSTFTADDQNDAIVNTGKGTDVNGDGVTDANGQNATFQLTKPTTYPDSDSNTLTTVTDPFTITVTVNDEDSATTRTTTTTVNNVAPTIVNINPSTNVLFAEGQAVPFIVTANDVSPPDRPNLLTHVLWGDGSAEEVFTGAITGVNTISRFAHVYNTPSTFQVEFWISDKEQNLNAACLAARPLGADGVLNGADFRACDNQNGTSLSQTVQVDIVNIPPVITDVFSTSPELENTDITSVALVDNRGADTLDYTFNNECNAANGIDDTDFVGLTRVASAVNVNAYADQSLTPAASGIHTVCVRVCDDDLQPNSCDFGSVDVEILNDAPVIATFPSPAAVTEGANITFAATASDIAGGADRVSVAIDCTDDGVTGNDPAAQNNVLLSAPPAAATALSGLVCNYPQSGVFTARLTLNDGDTGITTRTTTVRVNNAAPVFATFVSNSPLAAPLAEGVATVFTATATDAAGDLLTLQVDANNDGTFDLSSPFVGGTATAAFVFGDSGTRTVTGRVCDNEGLCAADRTTVVVNTNTAPTLVGTPSAANVNEGSTSTFTATATDVNDAIRFELDVDNNGTADAVSTTGSSPFTGSISFAFANDGTKNVRVRACDTDVASLCSAFANVTTTVANVAPVVTVNAPATSNEGATATVAAITTDAGNDTLAFVFTFTSGALTVRVPATGTQASSTGSAVLPEDGAWNVAVAVTDTANAGATVATTTQNATITVGNVAPVIAAFTAPATVNEGGSANLAVTASDAAGALDPVSIVFDCTDNGASADDTTVTNVNLATTATTTRACTYPDSGVFVARVTVTDDAGAVTDRAATVRVLNVAPTLATFTATTVNQGLATTFSATATDAGNDALTLQIDTNNDGTFDVTSAFAAGAATATATLPGSGARTTVARACDVDGACSATRNLSVTVNNLAPVLGTIAAADVDEGSPTTYTANATDPGNDAIRFEVDVDNNGSVDVRTTSGTATFTYATDGTKTFGVRACDDLDGDGTVDVGVDLCTAFATATTTVRNVAPVISAFTVPSASNEGASVTVAASATDAGRDALTFGFLFHKNDGDPVADIVVAASAASTVSRVLPEDGSWTVTVTVTDTVTTGAAGTATQSSNILVGNLAPVVLTFPQPAALNEGGSVTLTATASDAGGANDALTFAFDCNDDGVAETNVTATTALCTYPNSGVFTARVTVSDDEGASADRTTTVRVNNVRPVLTTFTANTVDQGVATTFSATGTDAGGDETTLQIDTNNDGTFDVNATFASGSATASATLKRGNTVVRGRICDAEGLCSAAQNLTVTVNNVLPVIATATAPDVNEGQATTYTTTATDVGGDAIRFEYDLDNNGSFETASATGVVVVSHATDANRPFAVRACDGPLAADCSAPTAGTTNVRNVAPVIAALAAPAASNEGATATVAVSATDAGNDALAYVFTFAKGAETIRVPATGTQAAAVASAVLPEDGTWTVSVAVSDVAGAGNTVLTTNASATIGVLNLAPVVTAFPAPAALNEGDSVTLTATATDAGGVNDPLTFAFDCDDDGTTDVSGNVGSGLCTYPVSGTFTARVTVSDDEGASATRTVSVRVNNVAPVLTAFTATTVSQSQATTFSATATDAGGDTVTLNIDTNNDGSFDTNATFAAGSATASAVLGGRGARNVIARACDSEGACSATQTLAVTVNNAAPVISSVNVPQTAVAGSPVTVNVAATDAGNDALSFTFAFTRAGSAFGLPVTQASPSLTTTFEESGAYAVTVTVSDGIVADDDTATVSFAVNELSINVVASGNPNPINEGQSSTISVSVPTGVGPFLVDFDMNGDGDANDAVDVRGFACDNLVGGTPCQQTANFPNNRAGDIAFRLLITVTDQGNADALSTAIVALDVFNVAPTLAAVATQTVVEGAALNLTLDGDDVSPVDALDLTYAVVSGPEGLTVDAATGDVTFVPTFDDEGANNVVVSVTDPDGATTETSFVVTVTIIDTNNNGLSDTFERTVNNGNLFAADAGTVDTDNDGETDLVELLAGRDPNTSDVPTAPVIVSPDNGLSVATATPTLTIANATSSRDLTLTYTFCVEDADGAELGCEDDVEAGATTTSVVFDAAVLDEEGSFSWYAVANDGLADGLESVRGTFVVDAVNVAPAPAPDAIAPANASSFLVGTLPALEARAVLDPDGDAVSYTFELATADTFAGAEVIATSDARDVPFFSITQVLAPATYFWRATATDGIDGHEVVGSTGNFIIAAIEVNEAPTAPVIVSPKNETIATTSAVLTITAGTDPENDTLEYEFELADNAAFANPTLSGAQAGLTFTVNDLAEDGTFFWRVRSFDGALYSDFAVATFVVDAVNAAPAGLAILSPADGSLLTSAPSNLLVQNALDPEGDLLTYTFTVSTKDDFSDVVATGTAEPGAATTSFVPGDGALELGATYFWKVVASDGTNSVEATAKFELNELPAEPDLGVTGGGCACGSSTPMDSSFAVAVLAGVALIGRRRRKA